MDWLPLQGICSDPDSPDLADLDLVPEAAGFQAVVSGRSHRPKISGRAGVLYVNPGSAGPRRFTLPIALAGLIVDGGSLRARVVDVG